MVENYLYFKSANGSPIEMNKNETKKVISKMFWPRKTLNKLIMWLSIEYWRRFFNLSTIDGDLTWLLVNESAAPWRELTDLKWYFCRKYRIDTAVEIMILFFNIGILRKSCGSRIRVMSTYANYSYLHFGPLTVQKTSIL